MELQENILTDIEATETEVPIIQRILANIIDSILEIGLLVLLYTFLPGDIRAFLIRTKPVSTYLVVFSIFTAYRLITILLFQRTIGMALCRSKYLNENFQPLSPGEKIIATFAVRTKKIKMYKV